MVVAERTSFPAGRSTFQSRVRGHATTCLDFGKASCVYRLCLAALIGSLIASPAHAAPLKAGDVVVAAVDAGGVIYHVDLATGRERVIGWIGREVRDIALAFDARGQLWVAYAEANRNVGGVVRMNPLNGQKQRVASGNMLVDPTGIAVGPHGDVLVSDAEAFNGTGGMIALRAGSGEQRMLSPGGLLRHPLGITVGAGGELVAAVPGAPGGPALVSVNARSGEQAKLSWSGSLRAPVGVVAIPGGDLLVANARALDGYGWVLRVDPVTGDQTKLCSGGHFREPQALAIGAGGDAFVVDRGAFDGKGGLVRVQVSDGRQTAGFPGQSFNDPRSIAIVPGSQPDVMINKGFVFGYDGKGVFNEDGAGQTRKQPARLRETRKFLVRVQNNGRFADSFVVEGAGDCAGFSARYYTGAEKGEDITTEVTSGTYVMHDLAPGAGRILRAEIEPESQSAAGGTESFLITARSLTYPARKDAVKAVVAVRP